jgi:hypothetical protein
VDGDVMSYGSFVTLGQIVRVDRSHSREISGSAGRQRQR